MQSIHFIVAEQIIPMFVHSAACAIADYKTAKKESYNSLVFAGNIKAAQELGISPEVNKMQMHRESALFFLEQIKNLYKLATAKGFHSVFIKSLENARYHIRCKVQEIEQAREIQKQKEFAWASQYTKHYEGGSFELPF
ncbi:hypothetical protein MY04_05880 (plasmid) [Flammeovirga sp. MY04]|uniref:hypothetical protein n=1 Tax=Flammeovirga sp. MY04 TaxID=1191459 RepID=UPI00080628D0|nr:hypothetical protein [Flammeovirga sp. MY04]ANQ52908.1 hypothetical protein MY04_05880 [Flammeovirga sp. MY04]